MVLFSELPEDIVLDVLHRLPSKSLAKFKCVSRRWHEHISGPCRSRRWRPTPRPMGFFFQDTERPRVTPIGFLFTAKESEELGNGDIDESVDFLGRCTIIVASSNGFLLCYAKCNRRKEYYIYNPATRQRKSLPKPPKYYPVVATGFSCKTDDPCMDSICYKVVRCKIPQLVLRTQLTVKIQTFSSKTGKWMTIDLTPDVPRPFYPASAVKSSAVVIDDVFYRFAMGPRIVAFDLVERRFRSINPPPGQEQGSYAVRLAAVNSLLHYGSWNGVDINIWAFEGDFRNGTAQWQMKHSVSLVTLANRYPDIFCATGRLPIHILMVEFHSADPRIVYLRFQDKWISYNIEDGVVEVVHDFGVPGCTKISCYNFFPYEWHEWPRVL